VSALTSGLVTAVMTVVCHTWTSYVDACTDALFACEAFRLSRTEMILQCASNRTHARLLSGATLCHWSCLTVVRRHFSDLLLYSASQAVQHKNGPHASRVTSLSCEAETVIRFAGSNCCLGVVQGTGDHLV